MPTARNARKAANRRHKQRWLFADGAGDCADCWLARSHLPGLDGEARRIADAVEQFGFGRSHTYLPALEAIEQSGSALGIEVGSDLVEQQDRGSPRRSATSSAGEDEAEEQRLLLAGRAARRAFLILWETAVLAVGPMSALPQPRRGFEWR